MAGRRLIGSLGAAACFASSAGCPMNTKGSGDSSGPPDSGVADCADAFDGTLSAGEWWGSDGYSAFVVRDDGSAEIELCDLVGEVDHANVLAGRFDWTVTWSGGDSSSIDASEVTGTVCGDRISITYAWAPDATTYYAPSPDVYGYGGCD